MASRRRTLKLKSTMAPMHIDDMQAYIDAQNLRGPVSIYRPLTRLALDTTEHKWIEFCSYMTYGDSEQALKNVAPPIVLAYLRWRLETSKFLNQRRSTVRCWWKVLSQLHLYKFRMSTSLEARAAVRETLQSNGFLVIKYGLVVDGKEKPVLGSDDFYDVLFTLHTAPLTVLYMRNERQRNRLWLFEHIAGYTGSRPGALVSRPHNAARLSKLKGSDKFAPVYDESELLSYKHCTLVLLPVPEQEFGTWAVEIQLRNTKGGVNEGKQPTIYPLFATSCLAQCPVMSFVTEAFNAGAFKSDLLSPQNFWRLKIPSHQKTLRMKWKDSIQDTPIFRNEDGTAWKYDQLRAPLIRLGKATGYPQVMTTYQTRRGFVNAIHGNVTSAQQNQAMDHTTAMFERFYQAGRLSADVQNTFLGLPTQNKLIKIFSSMCRSLDRARPTGLTEEETQSAYQSNENIRKLRNDRVQATVRCQESHGSVERSKGSEEYTTYSEACNRLQGLRRRAAIDALKAKQDQYDDSTDDVDNQINNLPERQPDNIAENVVVHPLRKQVNTIMFTAELPKAGSQEDIDRRIRAMTALLELCALEHAPDGPRSAGGETLVPADDDEESEFLNDEEDESEDESEDETEASGKRGQQTFDTALGVKDEDCLTVDGNVADVPTAKPVVSGQYLGRVKENQQTVDYTSRTSNAASELETKAGDLTSISGRVCENPSCASRTSVRWTPTPDGLLCNACRQYRTKNRGRLRPASSLRAPGLRRLPSLRTASLRSPKPQRCCVNILCGSSSASATSPGHQAIFGWLCDPCGEYFRKRGCLPPRPLGTAKSSRRRDLCHVDVDAVSDPDNSPPANIAAPAYLHLNINGSLLGQPATASMLLSEPTPPLTPCTSSIASSATSLSSSWLDASMPEMEKRRTDWPFIETLSSTMQNAGLQRTMFDIEPELGYSPTFSECDEGNMDFEWCLR